MHTNFVGSEPFSPLVQAAIFERLQEAHDHSSLFMCIVIVDTSIYEYCFAIGYIWSNDTDCSEF